jgi:branched-chain amino acid transport system substrate-binding protein
MHLGDRQPPARRTGGRLRARGVAFVALTGLAALGGCRGTGDVEGETVAIGLAIQVQLPEMISVRQGAELAVARLNDERPRGSRRFVLRVPPPSNTSAVQIALALRDDQSVVGVVGHTDSNSSLESAPIYEDAEHDGAGAIVAVSPTSTSPALTGRSLWVFRVCPSDVAASKQAARFALDSLRSRRAIIVYRNDLFGRGWTRAFADTYNAGGGTVLERDPHLVGMAEWEAYAGQVKQLKPDLVLFPGRASDAANFLRAVRATGASPVVLGSDAVSQLEAQGKEFSGVYYTAFFLPTRAQSREAREFVDEFQRRYHTLPDQRAALTYDATMLVGRAALATGANRARVRDYIADVGTKRPAASGVTGMIAFDAQHDVVDKAIVIARVGGG